MDAHPSQNDVFADYGPKRGGDHTLVVGTRSPEVRLSPQLRSSLNARIASGLQRRAAVIEEGLPRRGKKRSRKLIFLTIRLAKGVKPQAALKDVRRSIARCLECHSPQFLREKKAEQASRRAINRAKRRAAAQKLRGARGLSSFEAAFAGS